MSSRPIIAPSPQPLVNNGDMSGDITSPVSIIQMLPGISYDVSWSGSPVGVFQVQVSNSYSKDPAGNVKNAGTWTILPTTAFAGTYPVPSGSASNGFLDVVGTEAYAIRLVYVRTSGTGSLTVVAAAKVL